jgi:hypothetical protein
MGSNLRIALINKTQQQVILFLKNNITTPGVLALLIISQSNLINDYEGLKIWLKLRLSDVAATLL